jgi:hypothetical protein
MMPRILKIKEVLSADHGGLEVSSVDHGGLEKEAA